MAIRDKTNRPIAKPIIAPIGINQKLCETPSHDGMLAPKNAKMLAMKMAANKAVMLRDVARARKKYR
jgi:hypothetical protein